MSESTTIRQLWIEHCATAAGLRTISVEQALDYVVGEKLFSFLGQAESQAVFAVELPAFIAEIRRLFTAEEIGEYLNRRQHKKYRIRRTPPGEADEQDMTLDQLLTVRESVRFYRMRELLEQ